MHFVLIVCLTPLLNSTENRISELGKCEWINSLAKDNVLMSVIGWTNRMSLTWQLQFKWFKWIREGTASWKWRHLTNLYCFLVRTTRNPSQPIHRCYPVNHLTTIVMQHFPVQMRFVVHAHFQLFNRAENNNETRSRCQERLGRRRRRKNMLRIAQYTALKYISYGWKLPRRF